MCRKCVNTHIPSRTAYIIFFNIKYIILVYGRFSENGSVFQTDKINVEVVDFINVR